MILSKEQIQAIIKDFKYGHISENAVISLFFDTVESQQQEIERLKQWVNDLQSGMYVNCVYCGHRYGPEKDTPVSMADVLKTHIEQCPEHPMSKLKQQLSDIQKLYDDLTISRDEFADRAEQMKMERDSQQRCCIKAMEESARKDKALEIAREALEAAKPHVDIHSDMSPILVDKALTIIDKALGGNGE